MREEGLLEPLLPDPDRGLAFGLGGRLSAVFKLDDDAESTITLPLGGLISLSNRTMRDFSVISISSGCYFALPPPSL